VTRRRSDAGGTGTGTGTGSDLPIELVFSQSRRSRKKYMFSRESTNWVKHLPANRSSGMHPVLSSATLVQSGPCVWLGVGEFGRQ